MPDKKISNIAIIPARGGSKRIPGKNIRDFLGKPVIAYSIAAARDSGLFDVVMVSTDDVRIAEIAREMGAEVPFMRSDANSDDQATTSAVIKEVLEQYAAKGQNFDTACCIYPCAPFVTGKMLQRAQERMITGQFDSVLPVMPFSFPIWRSLKMDDDGVVQMNWPEFTQSRSQDLPAAFHDAGQFYIFGVRSFLSTGNFWAGKIGAVQISELEAQDIDNEADWQLAELKYKLLSEV